MCIFVSGVVRRLGRIHMLGECLVAVAALLVPLASHAQWAPNEKMVSPNPMLLDPEFSQNLAKFAWTHLDGTLYLGDVNRDTGAFEPMTGMGQAIATGIFNIGLRLIFNGPEWMDTIAGDQLFFTYWGQGDQPKLTNARIGLAGQDAAGNWVVRRMSPGLPRHMGITSQTPGDPNPQVMYWDPKLNYYWRNAWDSSSEQPLPFLKPAAKAWRFVTGMRAIIYSAPVDGVVQVFTYQLDTGAHTQMTFDDGDKDTGRQVPWMWRAPEFDNDYVFSTFANQSELRVYRKLPGDDGERRWTKIFSFQQPNGIINSVQYFIYNNKSYLYWGVYEDGRDWPTQIWMSNIDAADPLTRRISPTDMWRARSDPEHFITNNHGPVVYFNRYDPSKDPTGNHPMCPDCSEGVFMIDAGLLSR